MTYYDSLRSRVESLSGTKYRGYKPLFSEEPKRKSLGEKFVEELEKGDNPEKVFEKFIKIGTQQPGSSKKAVKEYLVRAVIKAREEGRI